MWKQYSIKILNIEERRLEYRNGLGTRLVLTVNFDIFN
jgi:hypothetical protein